MNFVRLQPLSDFFSAPRWKQWPASTMLVIGEMNLCWATPVVASNVPEMIGKLRGGVMYAELDKNYKGIYQVYFNAVHPLTGLNYSEVLHEDTKVCKLFTLSGEVVNSWKE